VYQVPGSLEDKIRRYGNVADMLRNVQVGAYTYPMKPEFSNWRDEQAAWKNTAVLFDQSFHMTDVYFRGPDVLRLLPDLGVNTFKNFGRNKAKQFVACNYATGPYDKVLIGDRLAGFSANAGYTVNVGGWCSLGMVDEADAVDGTEVTLVWGEENGGSAKPSVERHVQTTLRATLSTRPPV
jgi:glycine cleavage system aminomethyltransferase T